MLSKNHIGADIISPSDDLEARIKQAKEAKDAKAEESVMDPIQVGIELVAGVGVGAFIGYQLDKYMNTKPVFFLICFFFGAIAGGYNIYRSIQKR